MIYKDIAAGLDTDARPAARGSMYSGTMQYCIHCNKTRGNHLGWACDPYSPVSRFNDVPSHQRYLTRAMVASIAPAQGNSGAVVGLNNPFAPTKGIRVPAVNPPKPTGKDTSDWRSWRSKQPGQCVCGIAVGRCTYHGGWDLKP
jgi:hypothetical protein